MYEVKILLCASDNICIKMLAMLTRRRWLVKGSPPLPSKKAALKKMLKRNLMHPIIALFDLIGAWLGVGGRYICLKSYCEL